MEPVEPHPTTRTLQTAENERARAEPATWHGNAQIVVRETKSVPRTTPTGSAGIDGPEREETIIGLRVLRTTGVRVAGLSGGFPVAERKPGVLEPDALAGGELGGEDQILRLLGGFILRRFER